MPTARHPLDRLGQFAHWAVLLWALGLSLHERLAQLGALTAILLAPPLYTKAARELPRDVRRLVWGAGLSSPTGAIAPARKTK